MKGPRLLDLKLDGRVSGLLGPQEENLGPEHFGASVPELLGGAWRESF